jgi:hypothetical protein
VSATTWAAAAGLAVAAVVAANLTGALVGVFYDDGIYVALARSLAEGHGYRLLYLPGQPAAVRYPFLYPLFLAGLWKIFPAFPANVAVFKAANAALLGLVAALLVLYLRGRVAARPWLCALLVAGATTALPLVTVATVLFAEPLFLVLLVGACWAGDAARAAAERRRAFLLALLAGLLAGGAALARSLGVAAIAGVALSLLVARRPRAAVIAVAAGAACLVPWVLWTAHYRAGVDPAIVGNYGTYGDFMAQSGVVALAPTRLLDLLAPMGAVALAPFRGWLRFYLGMPALVLLIAGFVPLLMRAPALGWTLLGYLAIVFAWPFGPDRFLWAAWPLLAVAFAAGADRMWRRVRGAPPHLASLGRWCIAAVVAMVVVGYGYYQVRGYARGDVVRLQNGISATLAEVLPWIREATPPDAVVAGDDEAAIWLYAGRRAVPSYLWHYGLRGDESLGPGALHAWLLRAGATHVVLGGGGSDAAVTLSQVLGQYPGFLRLVHVWPGEVLAFAVDRNAGGGAP